MQLQMVGLELRTMDDFLAKLIENAEKAGYKMYLVGGSVRDELMGRELHDFDLTTDAPVSAIKEMLEAARPDTLYTLGEKFGTIGAIVMATTVEVTTFRSQDEVTAQERDPRDGALHTDLAHRDFTINAIARDLHTGELHDPFEGQLHIKHQLIGRGRPRRALPRRPPADVAGGAAGRAA